MELKREKKKLLSDSNLRLLSNLIISLSNTTTSVQERCVEPYEEGKVYQAGVSLVLKNSELYFCKVTNQDATWNPLHWELIGKEINEIDLDTVKSWLNLSQEELDNLQKLLKDDQITTTSTFSSSKIYSDLQAAIETAKEYTNEQTGKCVKPAYKVVASTSEITETGYFYLISNGTNYDMYVLSADGSVVSLGTSDVDLSDYAKLTDLDNYYDKSTSDGKFATITTVDTHIADTDVHVTKEFKDKLVTTDDMTTTIDSKKQILGFNDLKGITADSTLDDVVKAVPSGKVAILQSANFTNYLGLPHQMYTITINSLGYNRNQIIATAKYSNSPSVSFIGGCDNSSGTDIYDQWLKIPTTNDITTTINSSSTDTQIPSAKTVFDALKNKTIGIDYTYENSDSLNINLTKAGLYKIYSPTKGVPEENPKDYTLLNIPWRDDSTKMKFGYQMLFTPRCAYYWVRTVWNYDPSTYTYTEGDYSIFRKWQKVSTASVADVSNTAIESNDSNITINSGRSYYYVKNGICYVSVWDFKGTETCQGLVIKSDMPKTTKQPAGAPAIASLSTGEIMGQVYIRDNSTELRVNIYTTGVMGFCNFSYPVAES